MPPTANSPDQTQTLSLAQAMQLAHRHFQEGEFEACLYLSDRVLAAAPGEAMALQLSGLAAFRLGQMERALVQLEAASERDPQNALLLANMAEVFRSAKRLEQAIDYGTRAVEIGTPGAAAFANLALAHYDAGALDKAKDLHGRALAVDPGHLASLNNLGSIARDEKDSDAAITWYRRALDIAPAHHESRNNLTTVLIELDRLDEAEAEVAQVRARDPENAEALRNLGRICLVRLELDGAERLFRRALARDPNLATAHIGLSQVLLEKNHPELALQAAERAHGLEPDNTACLHQLGLVHSGLSVTGTAMRFFAQALTLDPEFAPSLMGQGHLHLEMGDKDQARAAFEAAAALDPSDTAALVALSRVSKPTAATDPLMQALERELPRAGAMPPSKQIAYRFGLADCYDALGRHDEAWAQYEAGAVLKRATIQYDVDARDAQVARIIETFTPAFLDQLRPFANPSARPIFVLGMPRSGTTLTETILASHSQVHGAGELNDLRNLVERGAEGQGMTFPDGLTGPLLRQRLDAYVATLDRLSQGAAFVTDKMPSNFDLIGVIHALLPNARIVHVARDGMDSCFSGFTRLFERSQLHSYDQAEMGRYYNGYRRLMDHWQRVLPSGAVHTVRYEDLVTDREAMVRALLDHCGLVWEDACLQSHKSKRRVRTASITQVREPIYTRSVGKWQRYAPHLTRLKEVIDSGP